jgi:hypothetical protein
LKGAQVLGLPDIVATIFVDSGVSLILLTVIVGQLTAQVNAAVCMLDFSNNYFLLFCVTYVSMASGLLHCVYLVQMAFAWMTGEPTPSNEPPKTSVQKLFFWARAIVWLGLLSFAFAVTLAALFDGKTTSLEDLPGGAPVVIFFVLMILTGLMEGFQIALFAVVNLPEKEIAHHKIAKDTCDLTFQGQNLQAFLIGRQICVTVCAFFVARITTIAVEIGAEENIFGVQNWVQAFFNTGILGALITTIVGSLAFRIIASSFPVPFLSNPMIYVILRVCLFIEASGVCSAAWLLGLINKQVVGFQEDEVYIGKPSERAEAEKDVDFNNLTLAAGNEELEESKATCIEIVLPRGTILSTAIGNWSHVNRIVRLFQKLKEIHVVYTRKQQ